MNIAIINYGMGNLGSVRRALEMLGYIALIAEHPLALFEADRIILPGVGSFKEAMVSLQEGGWVEALGHHVGKEGKALLGICLGMQLLADSSEEGGITPGLGYIPGNVMRLDKIGCNLRIPHIGWNDIQFKEDCQLLSKIPQGSDFYFVHSYAFVAAADNEDVIATTCYGSNFVAAVHRGTVFGCQFHPEKSSKAGFQVLQNFLEYRLC
jgi:imidazole glycerol-phosphate synthase subunit HisH